jgi:hypothetical protein
MSDEVQGLFRLPGGGRPVRTIVTCADVAIERARNCLAGEDA